MISGCLAFPLVICHKIKILIFCVPSSVRCAVGLVPQVLSDVLLAKFFKMKNPACLHLLEANVLKAHFPVDGAVGAGGGLVRIEQIMTQTT